MTATTARQDLVWVASLKPLSFYHLAMNRRTRCKIPIVGHGHMVALATARLDACKPCARCFPATKP